MSSSPPSSRPEKKHWWLTTRKVVDRYTREARALLATQQPNNASTALALLDSALALSHRNEAALELKARCLLFLRRFRDVAGMLQDYIPSFRSADEDDDTTATTATSLSSSSSASKHTSSDSGASSDGDGQIPLCFSVADLKRRLWSHGDREGQWRYIVLGQACYHLGMMEDALVLLQTGRRLAAASFRRESLDLHEDSFSGGLSGDPPPPPQQQSTGEVDCATALLNHVKQLLRRRAAAIAALDADLPAESARHFSKILDARRGIPHVFAAGCLIGRAAAHRAAGRVVEAIADCNRALAVDPGSIPALRARAELLEVIGSLPDCLRDLDHLKLLYDAVMWDRKLPGPPWKPHPGVRYRDIAGSLKGLTSRIQELRQRVAKGEAGKVDYHMLLGLEKGCGRSELQRAHLLLSLRHRPEKAAAFVDRLEIADEHRDAEAVRDQARTSAMVLYRMLQKGYSSVMTAIAEEEEEAEQRRREREKELAEAERARANAKAKVEEVGSKCVARKAVATAAAAAVFQGVFCRDLAAVSSLLSRVGPVGCSQGIPVKLEAMSC